MLVEELKSGVTKYLGDVYLLPLFYNALLDLEKEIIVAEQVALLYQLYLGTISGKKSILNRDSYEYFIYESYTEKMKKMVCKSLEVKII
jgi:hypothetical protein